ncbi:hypothetical protein CTKA_01612 [Chthonomonas calidirosea]|uniref:TonB-dependent receptor-like beta-barrel domain-containing protein n=1 Tax=Chthonomonas calidirosea (strain DSM 23976 / ICMP 18418 / T49) TaxID=1303518 RepID=S0EWJ9_CHTCT|nr:TonB-dependent receptor [Chthonomonas calidirosea]CCW36278.1 hypothetical protein CCALI_02480 [Chthonomonas calidirosea T49]CEK17808.1 hypothetical protein CTKA_01612 [Chthonomonas calidirosea]
MPFINAPIPSDAQTFVPRYVSFIVVNPATQQPLTTAVVTLQRGQNRKDAIVLTPSLMENSHATPVFDLCTWHTVSSVPKHQQAAIIHLLLNHSLCLQLSPQRSSSSQSPPTADIFVVVKASLLQRRQVEQSTTITHNQIQQFGGGAGATIQSITKAQAGVANDSAGQEHIRGEHAEISYVVDGVPLPEILSGQQSAVVVPSTIQTLQLLTGSYPPEFGMQTAGILNITTLPGARKPVGEYDLQAGSYSTTNGDLNFEGPIGKRGDYVFDFAATRTLNAQDPQQPDDQTAHNAGSSVNEFAKLRFRPSSKDTLILTLNQSPDTYQINNRTGLPDSFAQAGEGFGFLGLRNRDGSIPPINIVNPNGLGAAPIVLPSQQAEHMDIDQREVNEYSTLSWQRQLNRTDSLLFAVTFLHAGANLTNHNPPVDVLNLPIDNSIEYNPTAIRNVHHSQIYVAVTLPRKNHEIKFGILNDTQIGNESYQFIPASQLALDDLAVVDPALAPPGAPKQATDAQGHPLFDSSGKPVYVTDVYGNPVYVPTSNTVPTLNVHRSGFYRAAYIQDTWKVSSRFTFNYGFRFDWFRQGQNLGQPIVDTNSLCPRLNFAYNPDRLTSIRWSFNRLFNIPPLAQGSIVGAPIQPETLNQYDISVQRLIGRGQTVKLAYYIKDIRNQVDTGLLIPGSQIGLFSSVNFQIGGVHGVEFSYDLTPPNGIGLDGFVNYTYSIASPAGFDNTGAPAPFFNDHDQRNTVGAGFGYTWKNQANVSFVFTYGSGLASSVVPPSPFRTPNSELDLHLSTGSRFLKGLGALNLDIENVFDSRSVINFQSGFSGTRFQQGRRILLSLSSKF